MKKLLLAFLFCFHCYSTIAGTWHVGATQTYSLPGQVRLLVQNGDTIFIDGGIYLNDPVKWTKNDLTFIGLGTTANRTILRCTGNIANGKGIFVFETPGSGDNARFENIVFDGAQVSDADGGNGAGIRYQAKNLTVVSCKFMNCQNGILEGNGSVTTSNVTILNNEFENNGYQLQNDPTYSGYEHNIYISASADTLLVQNCYFHDPRGQANSLKTRAQRSFILYNLIDESNGYGSWELNIAQGGLNIVMGNIIIQGPAGSNHGIVGYDAVTNALEDFYFVNNTVINKFQGNIRYFNLVPATGINTFKIYNNIFASVPGASNSMFTGNVPISLDSAGNIIDPDFSNIGFVNTGVNDFSLTVSSTAVNAGVSAGITNTGYALIPVFEYLGFDTTSLTRIITGSVDAGAYEYAIPVGVTNLQDDDIKMIRLNNDNLRLLVNESVLNEKGKIDIYNLSGDNILSINDIIKYNYDINISPFSKGIYILKFSTRSFSRQWKFLK